jgi:hypothetical protein
MLSIDPHQELFHRIGGIFGSGSALKPPGGVLAPCGSVLEGNRGAFMAYRGVLEEDRGALLARRRELA